MKTLHHRRSENKPHSGVHSGGKPPPVCAGRHILHNQHGNDSRAVVLRPGPQGFNQISGDPAEQVRRAQQGRPTPDEQAALVLADQVRKNPKAFRPVFLELFADDIAEIAAAVATGKEAEHGRS